MFDQKKQKQIDFVFRIILKVLDKKQIEYSMDEKGLSINCLIYSNSLQINSVFKINPERMIVSLISKIPYTITKDKVEDLAAAMCFVNNFTANGCFDLDINAGNMFFRMTNGFLESLIGEEAYEYMISCSSDMMNEYSEQFILLAKGLMSLDEFVDRNGI